jgi:hypothetical protein
MRVPHPGTLTAALANAATVKVASAVSDPHARALVAATVKVASALSAPQARALIYETSEQQGVAHFCGKSPSCTGHPCHSVSATEIWEVAGFRDVTARFVQIRQLADGPGIVLTIRRRNGDWNITIRTPALRIKA